MKIIVDSCTIILLAKASVLEVALETFNAFITDEVFEELMKGKEDMLQESLLLDRLFNEKKIKLVKANEKITKKLMKDFNMGAGEASTLCVCMDEGRIIATDNRQGRKAANVNNLLLIGSIGIVVSLFKKKKITAEKARSSFKKLKEEGWFDHYLIEKALEDVK